MKEIINVKEGYYGNDETYFIYFNDDTVYAHKKEEFKIIDALCRFYLKTIEGSKNDK